MLCPISVGSFRQSSAPRKQTLAGAWRWGPKAHARVFTLALAIASDRYDRSLLVPFESCRNLAGNRFRGSSQRIVVEMRIACGGRRLRVAQQAPDDREAQPAAGTEARVGVPQIMQANADQTGALCDGIPRALQIVARLRGIVAEYNVRADPLHRVKHRESRCVGLTLLPQVWIPKICARSFPLIRNALRRLCGASAGSSQNIWRTDFLVYFGYP